MRVWLCMRKYVHGHWPMTHRPIACSACYSVVSVLTLTLFLWPWPRRCLDLCLVTMALTFLVLLTFLIVCRCRGQRRWHTEVVVIAIFTSECGRDGHWANVWKNEQYGRPGIQCRWCLGRRGPALAYGLHASGRRRRRRIEPIRHVTVILPRVAHAQCCNQVKVKRCRSRSFVTITHSSYYIFILTRIIRSSVPLEICRSTHWILVFLGAEIRSRSRLFVLSA